MNFSAELMVNSSHVIVLWRQLPWSVC